MPVVTLVERIDALLPQTQCGQCGHPGCRPYAEALAEGRDPINKCPPGGDDGIRELATLLQTVVIPFDAAGPHPAPRALAVIREDTCIGCTLCIQACPVDAIVGAAKQMHTVIAAECTGCELCVAPCPVDCIDLVPVADPQDSTRDAVMQRAAIARQRYTLRQRRKEHDKADKARRLAERAAIKPAAPASSTSLPPASQHAQATREAVLQRAMEQAARRRDTPPPAGDKMALIQAAMARAAALRKEREAGNTDTADKEQP